MKRLLNLSFLFVICVIGPVYSGTTTLINVSISQTTCVVTGLNELGGSSAYRVFPNPNSGKFSISSPFSNQKITIKITNVLGDVVWEATQSNLNNGNVTEVNFNKEPNGVYFVTIQEGNGIVFREKIIKN